MSSQVGEIGRVRIGSHGLNDVKRDRLRHASVAGLTAILLALTGNVVAAPGDLDPTFNGSGLLTLGGSRVAHAVAQQTDGKLVLAGRALDLRGIGFAMMVARVAEDGTLDSTFGGDGIAIADFPGVLASASAVIQQTDGKVVLAGSASGDVALARFNANGTLDASFGTGGKATLDIGGNDYARGLIEQPGGKYVIAGTAFASGELDQDQLVLARFNADGTLDTTFGSGGRTLVDFGGGAASGDLAQQSDGKLVAVGSVDGPTGLDVGIVRVTADGALDPSFDGDGLLTVDISDIDEAYAFAIQPDHAIVVAGVTAPDAGTPQNALLLRVNSDGSVDDSFRAGALPDMILNSIVVQEDGRLVATGRADNEGVHLILTRFNSDGSLDTAYGVDGVATADFGSASWGSALIRQTDGKYVAAGRPGAARFDDDAAFAGRIGLMDTYQEVLETTPTVTYTVRRTGGRTGVVSVDYATAAGEAQPGSDFEDISGTLTWNDGEASNRTLTINLIDDSVAEADEGFTLSLSTPTGGAQLAATEAVTIVSSEDGPGEFRFQDGVPQVTERDLFGDEAIRLFVGRSGGSTGSVSVSYSTFAGTATAGEDFQATSGTLSWADGETGYQFFPVAILDDQVEEGDEEFEIRLTDPTGGASIAESGGTQHVLILDNEASSPPPPPPPPPPPLPLPLPPSSGGGSGDGFLLGLLLLGLARRRGISCLTHFHPKG